MKSYEQLTKFPLFSQMTSVDIDNLQPCVPGYQRSFRRGEAIFLHRALGELSGRYLALLLEGRVLMEQENANGDSFLFVQLLPGELFGEVFLPHGILETDIRYIADTDCLVLFLQYEPLYRCCQKHCPAHQQLCENMVNLLVSNNCRMTDKIAVLSQKTLRDKLLAYLFQLSRQQESNQVVSQMNRTELAEYLCVNRSAMTRELQRMEAEGLLQMKKSTYLLLNSPEQLP